MIVQTPFSMLVSVVILKTDPSLYSILVLTLLSHCFSPHIVQYSSQTSPQPLHSLHPLPRSFFSSLSFLNLSSSNVISFSPPSLYWLSHTNHKLIKIGKEWRAFTLFIIPKYFDNFLFLFCLCLCSTHHKILIDNSSFSIHLHDWIFFLLFLFLFFLQPLFINYCCTITFLLS